MTLYHDRGYLRLSEKGAKGCSSLGDNRTAFWAVEDVAISPGTAVIDAVLLFAGTETHFVGEFGGGFAAFAGSTVKGCLDGGPVDAVECIRVPLLGF